MLCNSNLLLRRVPQGAENSSQSTLQHKIWPDFTGFQRATQSCYSAPPVLVLKLADKLLHSAAEAERGATKKEQRIGSFSHPRQNHSTSEKVKVSEKKQAQLYVWFSTGCEVWQSGHGTKTPSSCLIEVSVNKTGFFPPTNNQIIELPGNLNSQYTPLLGHRLSLYLRVTGFIITTFGGVYLRSFPTSVELRGWHLFLFFISRLITSVWSEWCSWRRCV